MIYCCGLHSGQPSTQTHGQAMRGVRAVIFRQDPARAFGDMRRVLTAAATICGSALTITAATIPGYPSSQVPDLPRKTASALAILPIGAKRAVKDHSQEWRLRHPEDAPEARS